MEGWKDGRMEGWKDGKLEEGLSSAYSDSNSDFFRFLCKHFSNTAFVNH